MALALALFSFYIRASRLPARTEGSTWKEVDSLGAMPDENLEQEREILRHPQAMQLTGGPRESARDASATAKLIFSSCVLSLGRDTQHTHPSRRIPH